MMLKNRLQNLVSLTEKTCVEWIKNENGQMKFVDPVDNREISAHYGATHMAAALIICGKKGLGMELLDSILDQWNDNMTLPGFHNDFNNFALCVIYDLVSEKQRKQIQKIVLSTPDSNHDTVNWLPMRWEVNRNRNQWSQDVKFQKMCEECRKKIVEATWSDGFIDDRLPSGLSFNLQYDVATVAVMQYLRIQGEKIDISKELGALLAVEAPDGDINYLGRGTNQIFAWGLWVYLLASSGQLSALDRAITFLENNLPAALGNHNLMLNNIPGKEKYMWWDYHYSSVYIAHFLMWLTLAEKHFEKSKIIPKEYQEGNSGVRIYRNDFAFAITFNGRKEYLAEYGPVLCALWTSTHGTIVKGVFGPWQGAFGNKHLDVETTLRNFTGLLEVKTNKDFSKNRILNKLGIAEENHKYESIAPCFCDIEISLTEHSVEISYDLLKKKNVCFNLSAIDNGKVCSEEMRLTVDGNESELVNNQMIKNQYGWCRVFQSRIVAGRQFVLKIGRK